MKIETQIEDALWEVVYRYRIEPAYLKPDALRAIREIIKPLFAQSPTPYRIINALAGAGIGQDRLDQIKAIIDPIIAVQSPTQPDGELAYKIRVAWEAGLKLARSYGDNYVHFAGEQKREHWEALLAELDASPAPPPPPTLCEMAVNKIGELVAPPPSAQVTHAEITTAIAALSRSKSPPPSPVLTEGSFAVCRMCGGACGCGPSPSPPPSPAAKDGGAS